ncbi:MAG: hypothetical protein NUV77_08135 [Thermoguttaceae bacterium]|jgi:hypothetical protein|nr:hypothetical protein [Thermoguttaceae bacterium]
MRLGTALCAILSSLAAFGAAALAAVAPEELPPVIPTRQAYFSIPFRIDPQAGAASSVTEVHLYVSDNRGATWRLESRVEPAAGAFPFRAPKDGEYWFAIHTLSRSGPLRPPATDRPGLRVVVDTVPPGLQLQARRGRGGEVSAQWRIDEPNLRRESFLLQYRAGPYQPWQTVAVDPAWSDGTGPVWTGEVTWWPQTAFERLEIRAEVSDTAGNTAVSHAQIGTQTETRGDQGTAASHGGGGPAGPAPATGPGATSARQTGWRSATSSADPDVPPTASGPLAGNARAPDPPRDENPVAIQFSPGSGDRNASSGRASAPAAAAGLPPGVRPRVVGARRFQLEYDVESVGPSGIARVELWGTRDGGRTWTSFGLDDDRRSPFFVTVNEEGVFGFRVAVQSGAGLGGDPPKSGDPPDLWVAIDLTKPTCRILSAEQAAGPQGGQLIIRWEAADAALAPKPVTLLYGQDRDGPWVPIASGLENSGQYAWTIDRRVPSRVYLRLEVRDEAGNLGIFETREPVSLDQLRPTVRIRQVRPFE